MYFGYAKIGINSPSPYTRTNGLKILNEISNIHFNPVLEIKDKLAIFSNDNWWEIKAQVIIICTNLLLYLVQDTPNNN